MNFVRTRSVIEKLMPISEITMYGKGNISLKYFSSFSPFNFIKQKSWFEMFSRFMRNQTYRIFLFLHISLYEFSRKFFLMGNDIEARVGFCLLVTGLETGLDFTTFGHLDQP